MESRLMEIDEQLKNEGGFLFSNFSKMSKPANVKFTPSKLPNAKQMIHTPSTDGSSFKVNDNLFDS